MRVRLVRFLVLVGVLGGCRTESGGVPRDPRTEPQPWAVQVESPTSTPILVDANTHLVYTLEATMTLVRSERTDDDGITGLTVIGEITERATGAVVEQLLVREGEDPELYSDDIVQGPYTHGHGHSTLLTPLSTCYAPPCSATERYTLTFDVRELPTLPAELTWRASLRVRLAPLPGDQPPYEAEGEALTLSIVAPAPRDPR